MGTPSSQKLREKMEAFLLKLVIVALCLPIVVPTGVYGAKALRIAACVIDQAGSTPVLGFLLAASGSTKDVVAGAFLGEWKNGLDTFIGPRLDQLLSDADYTKFVVLRDPVVRFASAFQHLCVRKPSEACPERDADRMSDVHAVLSSFERKISFAEVVHEHFRPFAVSCNLRKSLASYVTIPFDGIEAGLSDIVSSLPMLSSQRRKELLAVVKAVTHPEEYVKTSGDSRIGPPGESAALATSWLEAAAQGEGNHPDADIVPRLRRLYAEDFELYYRFLLRTNPTLAQKFAGGQPVFEAVVPEIPLDGSSEAAVGEEPRVPTAQSASLTPFFDTRLTAVLIVFVIVLAAAYVLRNKACCQSRLSLLRRR
jgi:hypothetical protein